MPIITFSEEDLRRAELTQRVPDQLHALEHERSPRAEWARNCVAALKRQFCDNYFLTSGQETVLFALDILDQERPF